MQSKLRNATDRRATMTVNEVSLVDVIQDPKRHQYRWKRVDRFSFHGTEDSIPEPDKPRYLFPVIADESTAPTS